MNAELRSRLAEAASQAQLREIITFFFRDHPQGTSFEGLKEMLYLHEDFKEESLQQLTTNQILIVADGRYTLSPFARQILDRDPVILMDEFLR